MQLRAEGTLGNTPEPLLNGEEVNGLGKSQQADASLAALASVAWTSYDYDVRTPTEESK